MSLNLTEVCIILELEMYFCQVVLKSLLSNIFLPILAEVNDLIFLVHLFYSFSSFCMSRLCLFLCHRTWYTRHNIGFVYVVRCIEGCVFVFFVHSQQAELKVRVKTINELLSAHQYSIDIVHIHLQEVRTNHNIASNVTLP